MSRGVKKEENQVMIKLLENVKCIIKNMQLEIAIAEEMTSLLLPQLVKFNKENNLIKDEEKQKKYINLYKKVYTMLQEYYVFTEGENDNIIVCLNKDKFLKEFCIIQDIKEVIKGVEELKSVEKLLSNIEKQRSFFMENKNKLKKIRSRNTHVEIEDVLDNIGTLTFENECTLSRFIRLLNLKLKELEK